MSNHCGEHMKRSRINLEVNDAVRQRLEDLQERSDAGSLTEVFRRALAVYDATLTAELDGGRVLLEAKDGTIRQLVIR